MVKAILKETFCLYLYSRQFVFYSSMLDYSTAWGLPLHWGWRNLTAKVIRSISIYTRVALSAALFLQTTLHAVSAG